MDKPVFLSVSNTILIIIDVQEKLWRVMYENEKLSDNLQRLIRGIQILNIPIILTEQYPQGIGPTVPEIAALLTDIKPLAKLSFSCCGDTNFLKILKNIDRKQVLVTGIESHVCVYQTAVDLLNSGYEVQAVTECVSSRTAENRLLGLQRIESAGGKLTGVEMALFELLKTAGNEQFKAINKIVK
ncbi:MAG: hydrolase [Dehalococcoidales bacterium]|nr:hydrolase [Dehalococcoidales bacterium]